MAQEIFGQSISRRDFLSKTGETALYFTLTPYLSKLNYFSHFESQESQKSFGVIKKIVHDSFASFYHDQKFVHEDSSVVNKNYRELITSIVGAIKKQNNPQTKALESQDDLKQYLVDHDVFLNSDLISLNKDDKDYVVVNTAMRKINKEKSKHVSFEGYYPEYLRFSNENYPSVQALRVEDNLLPENEESIKKFFGLDTFMPHGYTTDDGVIILFQEGIQDAVRKYSLSEQDAEQSIIVNEMAHVIVNFIFRDAFEKFDKSSLDDVSFRTPGNQSFSFLQLQEAFSTITQLKYGPQTEAIIQDVINDPSLKELGSYKYTNYLLSQEIPAVLTEMNIADGRLTTPEQFRDFKKKLIDEKLIPKIFAQMQSFVVFFKKQIEVKKR